MNLETKEIQVSASRLKTGIQVVSLSPGQSLKIETSPAGVDILDVAMPADKSWTAQIQVTISETDL